MITRARIVGALARYNAPTRPDQRRRAKAEAWVLVALVVAALVWNLK